ncbi:hypothetical protein BWI17_00615 [Betaproteobacteria bacterium GR16-43]|nr:hypothetical protein BWI17_00615 [Betaproteobacteria bacterium GR16-43]
MLAPAAKRVAAAVIDTGPLILFWIFAAASADYLRMGVDGILAAAALVFFAYHAGFSLWWSGETPGRRMMNIRLVCSRGADLTPLRAVLRPVVRVAWIAAFFPIALNMHGPAPLVVPICVDILLMFTHSWRQTTADFICGTLVVNSPAVQPHRAPAGPMYSSTDAEFGVRPHRHK